MAGSACVWMFSLAIVLLVGVPTVTSWKCTRGFGITESCLWLTSTCCSSGGYYNGKCCEPTTCTSGFYTSTCTKYTQSKCCSRSFGARESCCNYYDWSRTSSSSYWGKYSTYSAPIGAIVGGVIGGIVILVLIIVIPVVACGVCAAAGSNRRRQQTTVVTTNQGYPVQNQVAYANQGYAAATYGQTVPPTAQQPPAYGQAVNMPMPGQQPTGQAGAPPGQAMYPPPQGQYPPPAAADPAQPPPI